MKREYLFPLQPTQIAAAAGQLLQACTYDGAAAAMGLAAVERSLRSCARMLVDLEARADACGTLSIIAEVTPSGYWWLLRDCQALVALLCAASAIRSRTKVCLAEKHRFADAAAAIAQEIVRSVRAEETESTTRAPSL